MEEYANHASSGFRPRGKSRCDGLKNQPKARTCFGSMQEIVIRNITNASLQSIVGEHCPSKSPKVVRGRTFRLGLGPSVFEMQRDAI